MRKSTKTIFSLCLILVMVLSMIPAHALAFECAHENATCLNHTPETCGMDGSKLWRCPDCASTWLETLPATGEHEFVDGTCTGCGTWEPKDNPPVHEHDWEYAEIPTTGKHTKSCSCGEAVEEECTGCEFTGCSLCGSELLGIHPMDETGHCKGCGSCLDPVWEVKYDETQHWYECTCGEKYEIEKHVYVDGTCKCGAEEHKEEACKHTETYTDTYLPTCAKEGYIKTYCKACDELVKEEVLPVNDEHVFVDGKCIACEYACEHIETYTDTYLPTCEKEGYVKTFCKACDELISEEILPVSDEHVYLDGECIVCGDVCDHDETYTDTYLPTCEKEGYVKTYCKACNELVSEETLPVSDEHVYLNGECVVCGAAEPCNHDYVVVKELAPTCCEAGYAWYECSLCGAEMNREVGEADPNAHDYVVVKELAPTCVEAGYVWYECSLCGAELNHEVGEPTGEHDYAVVTTGATCEEDGLAVYTCTMCGDYYEEVLEALGHEYEEGFCTVCGTEEPTEPESVPSAPVDPARPDTESILDRIKDAIEKWFGGNQDETEPEETEPIETEPVETEPEETEPVETEPEETEPIETEPVETEPVETEPVETEPEESVPATPVTPSEPDVGSILDKIKDWINGWLNPSPEEPTEPEVTECEHNWEGADHAEPTCTEDGYKAHICTICGARDEYTVPATGHEYEDGVCTVCGVECEHNWDGADHAEPTCEEDGYKAHICTICGARDEYTVPATGHEYEDGTCIRCGAEEPTEPETVPSTPIEPSKPDVSTIIDMIREWFGSFFKRP